MGCCVNCREIEALFRSSLWFLWTSLLKHLISSPWAELGSICSFPWLQLEKKGDHLWKPGLLCPLGWTFRTRRHISAPDTLARVMGALRAEITQFPSSPIFYPIACPSLLVQKALWGQGQEWFSLSKVPHIPLDVEINKIPTVAATSPV